MYADFHKHRKFEAYKKAFEKAGGKASDFIIHECWIEAISPSNAVSSIAVNKAEKQYHIF